jgi:hypothetical protein
VVAAILPMAFVRGMSPYLRPIPQARRRRWLFAGGRFVVTPWAAVRC